MLKFVLYAKKHAAVSVCQLSKCGIFFVVVGIKKLHTPWQQVKSMFR